jgi:tRNA U34 2-thiouridine synthase MnmA/TrmU
MKGADMKAISLLSGGLDSTLATKLIMEQGIEVLALNFTSPFCQCGGKQKEGCRHKAVEMAEQLGVKLKIASLGEEFIAAVGNPKYGHGSGVNPCIDCRILKFKAAKKIMEEEGASFIITGEVLGQRPMSQNNRAMSLIERESGLSGYIVRPLCAKVIEPSVPEQKGWVDREKFHGIEGRSRKSQLKLVDELKIENHACPAGGCLLTDKNFSAKVRDLIDSGMFTLENTRLFKYGRYFSLDRHFKLVVGRNEQENTVIKNMARHGDLLIECAGKGPTAVARGKIYPDLLREALKKTAHYCRRGERVVLNCRILPDETAVYAFEVEMENAGAGSFKTAV